jgi:Zn-dependent protease with chaperone function
MPLRLLVRASKRLGANALALPDGTIIVTDDLVRLFMNKGKELDDAGKASLIAVLGHEVGHVQKRHATRTMARSSLAAAFSAALFGDFSAVAAGLPAVLSQMEYSRAMELEADDYGVWILDRNGLAGDELAHALEVLEDAAPEASQGPRWLSKSMGYLSTHPPIAERIRRLEARRQ